MLPPPQRDGLLWLPASLAGVRSERTLSRDELESILVSSGLDPDNDIVKSELAGVTQPDGTVVVNTAKRNSVLTKVRVPPSRSPERPFPDPVRA